jgi:HK97 family phage major capsid protein
MIEDKKLEKQAKELAKVISEEMQKDLKASYDEKFTKLEQIAENLTKKESELVQKVFVANDLKKDVSSLDEKESKDAFAIALLTKDVNTIKLLCEKDYESLDPRLKGLSEGTPADGGYLVPQHFYNSLVVERDNLNVMRQNVTIVPMRTNVLTVPKHETGPEVYWTGEGVTKTTSSMDFSQPTITAYKMASILYMTDELLEDASFNLTDLVVNQFASKIADQEEKVITNGAGTTQPTGIFVNASVPTITCAGNLSFDNIINLVYELPAKYRRFAKFLVHNNNVRELRKLKDLDGRYLWQEPVAVGQPATIQGYPVIETYWAPESQIAFGDYKEGYWLGERHGMRVKVTQDTETTFTQDKTGIRVVERIGGDVIVPNAIRKLITIP